jgi:signal transduction histidine kinase
MRRLVEDLLLIAKQESVTCSHEVYDLAAIVRETIGELAPLASAKNIHIQSALQSATGYGHSTAISVVADNLLRNAIQHDGGGGTVSVESQKLPNVQVQNQTAGGPRLPDKNETTMKITAIISRT